MGANVYLFIAKYTRQVIADGRYRMDIAAVFRNVPFWTLDMNILAISSLFLWNCQTGWISDIVATALMSPQSHRPVGKSLGNISC